MKFKLLSLGIIFVFFAGLATSAGEYAHNTKLYFGESMDINDYVIEYGEDSVDNEQRFRVGRWTGTSFLVLEELEGMELYESEGEEIKISENLSLVLEQTGYDEDGRFVELKVSGDKSIFSSGEMSSSSPDKIIMSRGGSEEVSLTLSNTGYLNQSYTLGSETNSSLETSFGFQDFNVTEVYVAAGEEESVTANVKVPEHTEIGAYDLTLLAENLTKLSETIQVEVRGAERHREMDIDIRRIYKELRPGESTEFRVYIGNEGGAPLEDINVTATPPDGWDYRVENGFKEELKNRRRHRAVIAVEAPPDAEAGDYIMEVSAESKRTSIEEPRKVRIHVRKKSGLAYIGVALMMVSLLILAVVYRKFQRR